MSKKQTSSHHKKLSSKSSNKKKKKDKERKRKAQSDRDQNKKTEKDLMGHLSSIEKLIDSFPKTCSQCSSVFNNKNDDHLDNWLMSHSDSGTVLTCDICKEN